MRKKTASAWVDMKRIIMIIILDVFLLSVPVGYSEAEEGRALKYTVFPSIYYLSDGTSVYDSGYVTSMPVSINRYAAMSFQVYYRAPAAAIVYDEDMNVLDVLEGYDYGELISYALPEDAYFLRVPIVLEQQDSFSIKGYHHLTPELAEQKAHRTAILKDDELPLEVIIHDGGMAKIFRTIGVVGDSLSSGAMTYNIAGEESKQKNVNMYEYSWIQYMARYCGSTAYNFSVSGMGTDTFFGSSYYDQLTDGEHLCQAYFIALGHNDYNRSVPIGTEADMDVEHWENNADTFIGNYAKIISTIKSVQPTAKIFPILMKKEKRYREYNDAIRYVASQFDNTYLLEMDIYAVERQDWEDTLGHGNTMGYLNYSYQISSYVDWIIRHHPEEFKYVQFIGTEYEINLGLR